MFEKATRMKLRWNYKGLCTVEDLWDLSLTALDSIYKNLNKTLKDKNEGSLLDTRTDVDRRLDLGIEIVKHVFVTKQEEAQKRKDAIDKKEKKNKIMGIIAQKQDEELIGKSVDDLNKLLEEL